MQLNSFNVDGRLTTDVEYSTTKNGKPMARWSYANNRKEHTNYFNCVAWNYTATYAHNYLYKGEKCAIGGEMSHTIMPDGKQYYTVIAHTLDPDRERNSGNDGSSTTLKQRRRQHARAINKQVNEALKYMPKNNPRNKK